MKNTLFSWVLFRIVLNIIKRLTCDLSNLKNIFDLNKNPNLVQNKNKFLIMYLCLQFIEIMEARKE